jgi:hypothetical protein
VSTLALAVALAAFLLSAPADAGVEPDLMCKEYKAKVVGKKVSDVLKAFGKNATTGNVTRLATDLSKAETRFTKLFVNRAPKFGCQTVDNTQAIGARLDAFVREVISATSPFCGDNIQSAGEDCDGTDDAACPGRCRLDCTCPLLFCGNGIRNPDEQCDGADDGNCPGLCTPDCICGPGCGNGVIERGERCDPPCTRGGCRRGRVCNGLCQCEPIAACACGQPDPPTHLRFTSTAAAGSCGRTTDSTGGPVFDLECGDLYIGGGSGDLVPATVPDNGTLIYDVACCNDTSITIRHTTAADLGTPKTCTGEGCFFGPPLPVVNEAVLFLSTCLINTVAKNATGALDCSTGDWVTTMPLDTVTYLRGIDLSPEPGWQPCPVCLGGDIGAPGSGICTGGPNAGLACEPGSTPIDAHDCCDGGASNGVSCTDDSECGDGARCVSGCSAARRTRRARTARPTH